MYLMHFKFQREKNWLKSYKKTFADYVMFQNSEPKLQKQQLKLLEDIFTQLVNRMGRILCIKTPFMEDH